MLNLRLLPFKGVMVVSLVISLLYVDFRKDVYCKDKTKCVPMKALDLIPIIGENITVDE